MLQGRVERHWPGHSQPPRGRLDYICTTYYVRLYAIRVTQLVERIRIVGAVATRPSPSFVARVVFADAVGGDDGFIRAGHAVFAVRRQVQPFVRVLRQGLSPVPASKLRACRLHDSAGDRLGPPRRVRVAQTGLHTPPDPPGDDTLDPGCRRYPDLLLHAPELAVL